MSEFLSQSEQSSIADLLRSEGVEIIDSENIVEVPSEFNEEVLKALGIDEENIQRVVAEMVAFINYPIIIDHFDTDHGRRIIWRAEMTKKYGDEVGSLLLHKNKLVGNHLAAFISFFRALELNENIPALLLEQIQEFKIRAEKAYVGYHKKSIKEKIEAAKQFDLICSDFVKMIIGI